VFACVSARILRAYAPVFPSVCLSASCLSLTIKRIYHVCSQLALKRLAADDRRGDLVEVLLQYHAHPLRLTRCQSHTHTQTHARMHTHTHACTQAQFSTLAFIYQKQSRMQHIHTHTHSLSHTHNHIYALAHKHTQLHLWLGLRKHCKLRHRGRRGL